MLALAVLLQRARVALLQPFEKPVHVLDDLGQPLALFRQFLGTGLVLVAVQAIAELFRELVVAVERAERLVVLALA